MPYLTPEERARIRKERNKNRRAFIKTLSPEAKEQMKRKKR